MIIWHVETSSGPRFDWANDEEHLRQQLIEYNNETLNDDEPDDQLAEDATLEEAIEKIEERENFSREDFTFPKMFVSVVVSSDVTQPRMHVAASRDAAVKDLRDYYNEMIEGDDALYPMPDSYGQEDVINGIRDDLNERAWIEERKVLQ